MVPRVKDNNPLGTQMTVSLDVAEEKARKGRRGNFKISLPIIYLITTITWLEYCR